MNSSRRPGTCVYVQSDQVFFFLRLLTMVIGEVCNLIFICWQWFFSGVNIKQSLCFDIKS